MSDAVTREETLLNAIATGEAVDIVPVTRKEKYLRYLAGIGEKPSKPITREEMFLDKIRAGGGVGEDEASVLDSLISGENSVELNSDVTKIRPYLLYNHSKVTRVNLPNVTAVNNNTFYQCSKLVNVNIPKVTVIGQSAFASCGAMVDANYPLVTKIEANAFEGCRSLKDVNFPLATKTENSSFIRCNGLTKIVFPSMTEIGVSAFSACEFLEYADFPVAIQVNQMAFRYSSKLKAILLRNSSVATLGNISAFNNTPIASGTGYIYVPSVLVDTYKSATNWSTYASQFRALEDYTVDGTITGELDESKI